MAIPHSELQDKYMQLSAPLTDDEVEWRVDQKSKDKKSLRLVPYIKQEVVTSRLNNILGFGNWSFFIDRSPEIPLKVEKYNGQKQIGWDKYVEAEITETTFDALIFARLVIHTDERDVVLMDGANDSDSGNIKGSISRSMPRVARLLNMGDELYGIGQVWVPAKNDYGDFDAPKLSQYIKQSPPPAPKVQSNVRPMTPPAVVESDEPSGDINSNEDFLAAVTESDADKPITTGAAQALAIKFDEVFGKKNGKSQRQMLLTMMTGRKIESSTNLTGYEGRVAQHLVGIEKTGRGKYGDAWEMVKEAVAIFASNGATNELWELPLTSIKPTVYDKLKTIEPDQAETFFQEQVKAFPAFNLGEVA